MKRGMADQCRPSISNGPEKKKVVDSVCFCCSKCFPDRNFTVVVDSMSACNRNKEVFKQTVQLFTSRDGQCCSSPGISEGHAWSEACHHSCYCVDGEVFYHCHHNPDKEAKPCKMECCSVKCPFFKAGSKKTERDSEDKEVLSKYYRQSYTPEKAGHFSLGDPMQIKVEKDPVGDAATKPVAMKDEQMEVKAESHFYTTSVFKPFPMDSDRVEQQGLERHPIGSTRRSDKNQDRSAISGTVDGFQRSVKLEGQPPVSKSPLRGAVDQKLQGSSAVYASVPMEMDSRQEYLEVCSNKIFERKSVSRMSDQMEFTRDISSERKRSKSLSKDADLRHDKPEIETYTKPLGYYQGPAKEENRYGRSARSKSHSGDCDQRQDGRYKRSKSCTMQEVLDMYGYDGPIDHDQVIIPEGYKTFEVESVLTESSQRQEEVYSHKSSLPRVDSAENKEGSHSSKVCRSKGSRESEERQDKGGSGLSGSSESKKISRESGEVQDVAGTSSGSRSSKTLTVKSASRDSSQRHRREEEPAEGSRLSKVSQSMGSSTDSKQRQDNGDIDSSRSSKSKHMSREGHKMEDVPGTSSENPASKRLRVRSLSRESSQRHEREEVYSHRFSVPVGVEPPEIGGICFNKTSRSRGEIEQRQDRGGNGSGRGSELKQISSKGGEVENVPGTSSENPSNKRLRVMSLSRDSSQRREREELYSHRSSVPVDVEPLEIGRSRFSKASRSGGEIDERRDTGGKGSSRSSESKQMSSCGGQKQDVAGPTEQDKGVEAEALEGRSNNNSLTFKSVSKESYERQETEVVHTYRSSVQDNEPVPTNDRRSSSRPSGSSRSKESSREREDIQEIDSCIISAPQEGDVVRTKEISHSSKEFKYEELRRDDGEINAQDMAERRSNRSSELKSASGKSDRKQDGREAYPYEIPGPKESFLEKGRHDGFYETIDDYQKQAGGLYEVPFPIEVYQRQEGVTLHETIKYPMGENAMYETIDDYEKQARQESYRKQKHDMYSYGIPGPIPTQRGEIHEDSTLMEANKKQFPPDTTSSRSGSKPLSKESDGSQSSKKVQSCGISIEIEDDQDKGKHYSIKSSTSSTGRSVKSGQKGDIGGIASVPMDCSDQKQEVPIGQFSMRPRSTCAVSFQKSEQKELTILDTSPTTSSGRRQSSAKGTFHSSKRSIAKEILEEELGGPSDMQEELSLHQKIKEQTKDRIQIQEAVHKQENKVASIQQQLSEAIQKQEFRTTKLLDVQKELHYQVLDQMKALVECKDMLKTHSQRFQDIYHQIESAFMLHKASSTDFERRMDGMEEFLHQFSSTEKSFVIRSFSKRRSKWKSPSMYSCQRGIKFCIEAEPAADSLHFYFAPMKGFFDDDQHWPIKFTFTLRILNHCEGSDFKAVFAQEMDQHQSYLIGSLSYDDMFAYLKNDAMYIVLSKITHT